jgi:hypothetical protein
MLAVTSNWSKLRRITKYMERISKLGTTLAVTSNWSTQRRNTNYMERIKELGTTLVVTGNWSTLWRNTNCMERISKLGTTLAVTSNRCIFLRSVRRLLVTASVVPSSPILVILMMEAISSSETSVLTRATRHNIQENTTLHIFSNLCCAYLVALALRSLYVYTVVVIAKLVTLHKSKKYHHGFRHIFTC